MRDWWLVLTPDEIDVCEHDPGFGTDVAIDTPLRTFTRICRGDLQWDGAARAASLQVRGPTWLRRQVPDWLQLSYFASVPRPPAAG